MPFAADKNKPVYAHFFGETREIVNGKVVKEMAIQGDYNGKKLHIDKRDNNQISHFEIKDTNLKNFLLRATRKHKHSHNKRSKHKHNKHSNKQSHNKNSHKHNKHSHKHNKHSNKHNKHRHSKH